MYMNLKMCLWQSGMRQNRLAQALHMDEALLSRIINGFREPTPDQRARIAEFARSLQIPDMAHMQYIETTVCEYDTFALDFIRFDYLFEFREVPNFIHACLRYELLRLILRDSRWRRHAS